MQRQDLLQSYLTVRQLTEQLCEPLEVEDYLPQPIQDVSPPKWHLAHTTWFFETFILKEFLSDFKAFHPEYNYLFNSYYQTLGTPFSRPHRGDLSRPTVAEVYQYRAAIDEQIADLLNKGSLKDESRLEMLMILGLHHEQQHQELLITDLKYILAQNPVMPGYGGMKLSEKRTQQPVPLEFHSFEGGLKKLGWDKSGFCFDNERPGHQTYLAPFGLANRLVTNGEFLEFIQEGGYSDFRHWLSDGWDWVQENGIEAPLYWMKADGERLERTLAGDGSLDSRLPVSHVSFYEAEAYASWAGKRLATEQEWEVAAVASNALTAPGTLLDDQHFHPSAAHNGTEKAMFQLVGDVWEWTSSAYLPYPGYRHSSDTLGEYNGKFMSGQMVLRGGSCATPKTHIRLTYRNFFQPEKRWQFTGIRLAQDIQ
ncbi:MAG: ergothioneine biosynthesis protein EgtB [Candidatus Marinimicrobia bacterium]|nr:ergothioneine biosynthesis protein EgtB [Candidatus Neomarinimicrobiota bacterium]MCF7839944.1 ergothioneine biosynthesis protein EgtB [Candidatus Neomarinimicrobiota bacterium]